MRKIKTKYNFYTGEIAKKVKKVGYKYLGRGKIGKIATIKIDGKTAYYLTDEDGFERYSPYTFDKKKFKKVEYEEWEWESRDFFSEFITKQKSKDKVVFNTKIKRIRGHFGFLSINLGEDWISFANDLDKSKIIKELQLKEGDEIKVIIEKISKKKK